MFLQSLFLSLLFCFRPYLFVVFSLLFVLRFPSFLPFIHSCTCFSYLLIYDVTCFVLSCFSYLHIWRLFLLIVFFSSSCFYVLLFFYSLFISIRCGMISFFSFFLCWLSFFSSLFFCVISECHEMLDVLFPFFSSSSPSFLGSHPFTSLSSFHHHLFSSFLPFHPTTHLLTGSRHTLSPPYPPSTHPIHYPFLPPTKSSPHTFNPSPLLPPT